MAVSIQRYRPDTCDCVIEQTHDPKDPGYGVRLSKFLTKCVHHQGLSDSEANDVILASPDSEQKRKNLIYRQLLEDSSLALSEIVKNENGDDVLQLKPGVVYDWQFDVNRLLIVTVTKSGAALDLLTKTTLQASADSFFGAGKVQIL